MKVAGDQPMGFTRQFLWKDTVYEMRIPSRGYLYELDPPVPVNVLEGNIKGEQKKPILGYVPKPWNKYPPGPPPAGADASGDKAGGGSCCGECHQGAQARRIIAGLVLFALAPFALHAASDAGSALPVGVAAAAAAGPPSPNVRIVFTIVPSTKKAMVFWGKSGSASSRRTRRSSSPARATRARSTSS